jgi:hypothetical protein
VAGAKAAPHGKFMENHGCTYDPRPTTDPHTIVVSDRRNMRFEFFHYDPESADTFEYLPAYHPNGQKCVWGRGAGPSPPHALPPRAKIMPTRTCAA